MMSKENLNHRAIDQLSIAQMRQDIAKILHESPQDIQDEDNLIELGLDSIRTMALLSNWLEGVDGVSFADFAEKPVLSYWWELVQGLQFKK